MTQIDRLLSQANPVPTPPQGHVTAAQERLLSSIVAVPPRRRRAAAVRRLVAACAVLAVAGAAVAAVLAVGREASVNDEVAVTAPAGSEARLIHVVTRLYGREYGPGRGERLDGWLEPATGRVRIVVTTGGETTLQQVADGDDHVQTWQDALGNVEGYSQDVVASDFAAELRAQVRDRMAALIESSKDGFRDDNATVGAPTTETGEYQGRAVTIHRVAPTIDGGRPSGYYFKWYTDRDTGAIIAFERGRAGAGGRDTVDQGEELEELETFPAGYAPLHELGWHPPPTTRGAATPTPTPAGSPAAPTPTPTPADSRATPTPTPTPARPSATPTPTPAPSGR
jgi:hypothetical protein